MEISLPLAACLDIPMFGSKIRKNIQNPLFLYYFMWNHARKWICNKTPYLDLFSRWFRWFRDGRAVGLKLQILILAPREYQNNAQLASWCQVSIKITSWKNTFFKIGEKCQHRRWRRRPFWEKKKNSLTEIAESNV